MYVKVTYQLRSRLRLQAIEKPFLEAVKEMFGCRYTPKLEVLYTVTIHYIISLLTLGFSSKMLELPRDALYVV